MACQRQASWRHIGQFETEHPLDASTLAIRNGVGVIELQSSGQPSRVRVLVEVHHRGEAPGGVLRAEDHISWKQEKTQLVLQNRHSEPDAVADWRLDLRISAPPQTNFDIRNEKGRIQMTGGGGDVRVQSGLGEVELDGQLGQTQLRAAMGNVSVRAERLWGGLRIDSGNGDVEAHLRHPIPQAGIEVQAGLGDVLLVVPQASHGKFRLRTDFGDIQQPGRLRVQEHSGIIGAHMRGWLGSEDATPRVRIEARVGDIDVRMRP